MKTLEPGARFMLWAVWRAIRHPRTPIKYYICPGCRVRVPPEAGECPVCKDKLRTNPELVQESPLPWFASVLIIIIGIACWITSAVVGIPGLDHAGEAMVYLPLGNLFGMSRVRWGS